MTSSLVGSEMCIRDRTLHAGVAIPRLKYRLHENGGETLKRWSLNNSCPCLLYTSDAADDM
eukprot:10935197-Prorocentrum_lima.AAC.1